MIDSFQFYVYNVRLVRNYERVKKLQFIKLLHSHISIHINVDNIEFIQKNSSIYSDVYKRYQEMITADEGSCLYDLEYDNDQGYFNIASLDYPVDYECIDKPLKMMEPQINAGIYFNNNGPKSTQFIIGNSDYYTKNLSTTISVFYHLASNHIDLFTVRICNDEMIKLYKSKNYIDIIYDITQACRNIAYIELNIHDCPQDYLSCHLKLFGYNVLLVCLHCTVLENTDLQHPKILCNANVLYCRVPKLFKFTFDTKNTKVFVKWNEVTVIYLNLCNQFLTNDGIFVEHLECDELAYSQNLSCSLNECLKTLINGIMDLKPSVFEVRYYMFNIYEKYNNNNLTSYFYDSNTEITSIVICCSDYGVIDEEFKAFKNSLFPDINNDQN
jgi:hypothetical protein